MMTILNELLKHVPMGEENAVTGRLIWRQIGMWSADGIRRELHKMVAQGLVQSKKTLSGTNEINLYFRRTSPAENPDSVIR